MATTLYRVNDAFAVKLWAQRLAREAISQAYIGRFIGEDTNSLIFKRTELNKGAGDKITYGLREKLTGAGVLGDDALEDNEESLITRPDTLYVDQLRHGVRSGGKMSDQRVPFSVRDEARAALVDWWADRYDDAFIRHITGDTNTTDTRYTGANTTTAPTSTRVVYGPGHTAESSISTTDVFSLTLIDRALEKAKVNAPIIRPARVNGEEWYVCFIHPYHTYDLQASTTTGQWLDIQKAAMQGGNVDNNPLFKGALGVYKGVILHESARIPVSAGGANYRRAVLCGAQAATIAFAGGTTGVDTMNWTEQLFDYGNQLGVATASIWGLKKNVFNSVDFATVAISAYAVSH